MHQSMVNKCQLNNEIQLNYPFQYKFHIKKPSINKREKPSIIKQPPPIYYQQSSNI